MTGFLWSKWDWERCKWQLKWQDSDDPNGTDFMAPCFSLAQPWKLYQEVNHQMRVLSLSCTYLPLLLCTCCSKICLYKIKENTNVSDPKQIFTVCLFSWKKTLVKVTYRPCPLMVFSTLFSECWTYSTPTTYCEE